MSVEYKFVRRHRLTSGLFVDVLQHWRGFFWVFVKQSGNNYRDIADSDGYFFNTTDEAIGDALAIIAELGFKSAA